MVKILRYKNLSNHLMIFILCFGLNLIVALFSKTAAITPDELGTLSIAAYLSGHNWSLAMSHYSGYYGYGAALLYAPLFLLFKNGVYLYKAIIVLNSLLMAIIPVIALRILSRVLNNKINIYTVMIALVSGMQPVYLIFSKRAWNESIIILTAWFVIYLVGLLLVNTAKKNQYTILLSFALVYGYATHGRFLAIFLAVFILIIVYQIIERKALVNYYIGFLSLTIGLTFDKFLTSVFLKNVWLVNEKSQLRNTMGETLVRIFTLSDISNTIYVWIRAFYSYSIYSVLVSFGVLVVFICVWSEYCWRSKVGQHYVNSMTERVNVKFYYGGFLLLQFLGSIVIAILFFTTDFKNEVEYYYMYGRYFEYLLGPIILLTFSLLCQCKISIKQYISIAIIILLMAALFFVSEYKDVLSINKTIWGMATFSSMVPGLFVLRATPLTYIFAVSSFALLAEIIVFLIFKRNITFSLGIMLTLYIMFYTNTSYNFLIPQTQEMYDRVGQLDFILNNKVMKETLLAKGFNKVYINDRILVCHQMVLDDYAIIMYDANHSDDIFNAFLISKNGLPRVDSDEVYRITYDDCDTIVLAVGSELAYVLEAQGYTVSPIKYSYELGNKIEFKKSAQNGFLHYLNSNTWWKPEETGMWSKGNASLNFSLDQEIKNDLICEVNVHSFYQSNIVSISVNGVFVNEFMVQPTYDSSMTFIIPKDIILQQEDNRIEFTLEKAPLIPSQVYTDSLDGRELGIWLSSFYLSEYN